MATNLSAAQLVHAYGEAFGARRPKDLSQFVILLNDMAVLLSRDQTLRINIGREIDWPTLHNMWHRAQQQILVPADDCFPIDGDTAWCLSLGRFTRNLVAGVTYNQESALPVEPGLRRIIHHYTSFYRMQDPENKTHTRVFAQVLSNLATGNESVADAIWPLYMDLPEEQDILTRLLSSPDTGTINSSMVFILNCTNEAHRRTDLLVRSPVGVRICRSLLERSAGSLDAPAGSEEERSFELSYRIFQNVFRLDLHSALWDSIVNVEEPITPHQTTLLKLLDSYLQAKSPNPCITGETIHFLLRIFSGLGIQARAAMSDFLSPNEQLQGALDSRLPFVCEALVLASQSIISVATLGHNGSASHQVINSLRNADLQGGLPLLEGVVDILRLLERFLPRIVFGKAVSSSGQAISGHTDPTGFVYVKRDLVRLLGLTSYEDADVQDRIRECGGIQVVMNLCVVDERNPYLREHALFTLRNLLHGNVTNQELVDSIKPMGAWDKDGILQDVVGAVRK